MTNPGEFTCQFWVKGQINKAKQYSQISRVQSLETEMQNTFCLIEYHTPWIGNYGPQAGYSPQSQRSPNTFWWQEEAAVAAVQKRAITAGEQLWFCLWLQRHKPSWKWPVSKLNFITAVPFCKTSPTPAMHI